MKYVTESYKDQMWDLCKFNMRQEICMLKGNFTLDLGGQWGFNVYFNFILRVYNLCQWIVFTKRFAYHGRSREPMHE